jgi:drug/metabolite transporter (DMT)-like permease
MPNPSAAARESPTQLRARLLIVVAAVMWSTSGLFAKAPWFEDWPIEQRALLLAFWRALFAASILLPMVRRPRWNWGLVPMVVLFAAMNYTYLSAMTRTTAANAIWLQNTAPIWVFLVGVTLFGEPVDRRDWLLVACGTLGVLLIVGFEAQGEQLSGTMFGILGGVTYAGVVLSIRRLRGEDAAWLIALNHLVTALLFLPFVLRSGVRPSGQQLWALAGFGILQMGIPYLLFARGVRVVTGHEASGLALLEPLLVPVWVFLAWHAEPTYQPPRWWTFVGAAFILAGLVMRYLGPKRRPRALARD